MKNTKMNAMNIAQTWIRENFYAVPNNYLYNRNSMKWYREQLRAIPEVDEAFPTQFPAELEELLMEYADMMDKEMERKWSA